MEEGGETGYPFEIWYYNHLDGIGVNIDLEFADACLCGNYRLVPTKENATIRLALQGRLAGAYEVNTRSVHLDITRNITDRFVFFAYVNLGMLSTTIHNNIDHDSAAGFWTIA